MGGILINGRGEALNESEKSIPGLYAAGDAIGGLMGGYRGGYTGGLMQAVVTGILAGENAAQSWLWEAEANGPRLLIGIAGLRLAWECRLQWVNLAQTELSDVADRLASRSRRNCAIFVRPVNENSLGSLLALRFFPIQP